MWCLFSQRDAHIHRKYWHWDAHIHVNIGIVVPIIVWKWASGMPICFHLTPVIMQESWWWKSSLITWSRHSKAFDRLILREFKGQNVATPAKYPRKCVDRLILVVQNSSWSLDWLHKTLIAWFLVTSASTCDAYVTTPCLGMTFPKLPNYFSINWNFILAKEDRVTHQVIQ